MYKLLLVDDEPMEMRYTRAIVEQSPLEVTVIGEALNGDEAFQLCRTDKPHIIFMDIKLPGLDGLAVTKRIKEEFPETKIIIVTAYDEFEFACEALKLGASDYLLKPVSRREITSILRMLLQQIQGEEARREIEKEAQLRLASNRNYIEAGLVLDLILGMENSDDEVELERFFGIDLNQVVVAVASTAHKAFGEGKRESQAARSPELWSALAAELAKVKQCIAALVGQNRFVVIWGQGATEPQRVIAQLETVMGEMGYSLYWGIGSKISGPGSCAHSFREAVAALNWAFIQDDQPVQHFADLRRGSGMEDFYPVEREQAILVKLRELDSTGFRLQYQQFIEIGFRGEDPGGLWRLRAIEFIVLLHRTVREVWPHEEVIKEVGLQGLRALLNVETCAEVTEYLQGLGQRLVDIMESHSGQVDAGVINKAILFLEANYHLHLSLENVAEQVHISPYHFSRLFRQHTGSTFLEYLTQLRITRAKILLRSSDLPMAVIGKKVGYPEPNYFSRVFRKQEGLSPSQYRRVFQDV